MALFEDVKWCACAKKYDLLTLFVVSKWFPSVKKYDLLPVIVISKLCPSAEVLVETFVIGFEAVLQC